jgi:pectate lyase
MDDRWETAHNVTNANADADGDGYTNFEEFLNELAGDQDTNGKIILRTGAGQGAIPAVNCGITAV